MHEEIVQVLENMLAYLRQTLGDLWQDEWVEHMQLVPRESLPIEILGKELAIDPATLEWLINTIREYVEADSWAELLHIISEHSQLLSPEALHLLDYLTHAQENQEARRFIEDRRGLLRRCSQIGIDAALHERQSESSSAEIPGEESIDDQAKQVLLTFIHAQTWAEKKRIVGNRSDPPRNPALDNRNSLIFGCPAVSLGRGV
jgi:hypothetical protein